MKEILTERAELFDPNMVISFTFDIAYDMMLEATSLGLGSVWETYFKADIIASEFDLPKNLEPINILAVGYGKGKPQSSERHSKTRKPMNEIITRL